MLKKIVYLSILGCIINHCTGSYEKQSEKKTKQQLIDTTKLQNQFFVDTLDICDSIVFRKEWKHGKLSDKLNLIKKVKKHQIKKAEYHLACDLTSYFLLKEYCYSDSDLLNEQIENYVMFYKTWGFESSSKFHLTFLSKKIKEDSNDLSKLQKLYKVDLIIRAIQFGIITSIPKEWKYKQLFKKKYKKPIFNKVITHIKQYVEENSIQKEINPELYILNLDLLFNEHKKIGEVLCRKINSYNHSQLRRLFFFYLVTSSQSKSKTDYYHCRKKLKEIRIQARKIDSLIEAK